MALQNKHRVKFALGDDNDNNNDVYSVSIFLVGEMWSATDKAGEAEVMDECKL